MGYCVSRSDGTEWEEIEWGGKERYFCARVRINTKEREGIELNNRNTKLFISGHGKE